MALVTFAVFTCVTSAHFTYNTNRELLANTMSDKFVVTMQYSTHGDKTTMEFTIFPENNKLLLFGNIVAKNEDLAITMGKGRARHLQELLAQYKPEALAYFPKEIPTRL